MSCLLVALVGGCAVDANDSRPPPTTSADEGGVGVSPELFATGCDDLASGGVDGILELLARDEIALVIPAGIPTRFEPTGFGCRGSGDPVLRAALTGWQSSPADREPLHSRS